jgi:phenylpyruvate tautomerase PptA (4-oxalocrotonate tautomerase family)
MRDWMTPLDTIDSAVLSARAALARADLDGIKEALGDVPEIVEVLLGEVEDEQFNSGKKSNPSSMWEHLH